MSDAHAFEITKTIFATALVAACMRRRLHGRACEILAFAVVGVPFVQFVALQVAIDAVTFGVAHCLGRRHSYVPLYVAVWPGRHNFHAGLVFGHQFYHLRVAGNNRTVRCEPASLVRSAALVVPCGFVPPRVKCGDALRFAVRGNCHDWAVGAAAHLAVDWRLTRHALQTGRQEFATVVVVCATLAASGGALVLIVRMLDLGLMAVEILDTLSTKVPRPSTFSASAVLCDCGKFGALLLVFVYAPTIHPGAALALFLATFPCVWLLFAAVVPRAAIGPATPVPDATA